MRASQGVLLVCGLMMAACHSSTTPTTTTAATSTATATTYSLAVSGSPILSGLRERSQMSAIITNEDGTTQDVTKTSTWLSSDTTVATITSAGVVTTITPGHTHLTAVYQTTNQGFDLDVVPVTTTLTGFLRESDGLNGIFSIIVHSATDQTPNTVSAQVSGTFQIGNGTVTVSGFFESLTGAITFSGGDMPYRFDGAITNGVLNATFAGPNGITGVIASTSLNVS